MRACSLLLLFGLTAPGVCAQTPVFADSFDGPPLAAHWSDPAPSAWTYSFADGVLQVNGLHNQATQFFSTTAMGSVFEPTGDFLLEVNMGWQPGIDRDLFLVLRSGSDEIARLGYTEIGFAGNPRLFIDLQSAPLFLMAAPSPGLHAFSIERQGSTFSVSIDGQTVHTASGSAAPASGLRFDFAGPTGEFPPLLIDEIRLIPAPAAGMLLVPFACRRRR